MREEKTLKKIFSVFFVLFHFFYYICYVKIDIKSIIINESNINSLKDESKDSYNIKKLLGVELTQSQSIRFGNTFQKIIKDIIKSAGGQVIPTQFADVYNVGETKQNKGKKDVDIWFKLNNKMYYFEAKTSLDLDSEKSKATDNKVSDISVWMRSNYSDYEVISGVLSCWFKKETGLPVKVKNVFYMEDLFKILDIEMTSDEYYSMMKDFGKSINS